MSICSAGAITFTPSKTARLGKKLALPIHPEIEAFLLKHPAGASDEAPLFPTLCAVFPLQASRARAWPSGASWSVRESPPESPAKPNTAALGRNVSARSFHSLRHSFVTALAHANVAIELRQKTRWPRERGAEPPLHPPRIRRAPQCHREDAQLMKTAKPIGISETPKFPCPEWNSKPGSLSFPGTPQEHLEESAREWSSRYKGASKRQCSRIN